MLPPSINKAKGKFTLTLQGGLLREKNLLPAIKVLKTWADEGKIEIFESDRAKEAAVTSGWPGAQSVKAHPKYKTRKKLESGGITFQRISSVLFPERDSNRLNMNEINHIAHLLCHHSMGHSIFVTVNTKEFIEEGRRERLMSAFKIIVLTPDEAVKILKSAEMNEPPPEKKEA